MLLYIWGVSAAMIDFWYVWEIVINIITTFLIIGLITSQLTIESHQKKYVYLSIVAIVAIMSAINYFNVDFSQTVAPGFTIYWNRLITSALFFIYSLIVPKGNLSEKIMWCCISMFIISLADFVSLSVTASLFNTNIYAVTQYGYSRLVVTIIHLGVIGLCCLLLSNRYKTKMFIPTFIRYLLIIVTILGTLTIDILVDNMYFLENSVLFLNVGETMISVTFLFIIVAIFVLVMRVGILTNENMAYALEVQQKKLESDSFQQMAVNVSAIREIKHDINNHMEVMQRLLTNENYDELGEYFESITGIYSEKTNSIIVSDPIINSLIYSKIISMKKERIVFTHQIYDLENLTLNNFDTCSILGNLLNNAIEACQELPNHKTRYINMIMKKHLNLIIIQVDNSYDGKYQKNEFNRYISKKTGEGHGLGINHVQRIVESYGGHMLIDPKEATFHVKIYIPYKKI